MAICPYCEAPFKKVKLEVVDGKLDEISGFDCLAFCCPACDHALSVTIDVSSLRADVLDAVLAIKP